MRTQRRKNYLTDIDPIQYNIIYKLFHSLVECYAMESYTRWWSLLMYYSYYIPSQGACFAMLWFGAQCFVYSSFSEHNKRSMQYSTFNGDEKPRWGENKRCVYASSFTLEIFVTHFCCTVIHIRWKINYFYLVECMWMKKQVKKTHLLFSHCIALDYGRRVN